MPPNKHTANVLDALIRGRDLIYKSKDITLSLEEFAMGSPLFSRDFDLCWGFAAIEPELPENYGKELVISTGVSRLDGDLLNIPDSEEGLSLSSLLDVGGSEPLQNVYAIGSVFLGVDEYPDSPDIVPLLLRGGDGTGRRVLLSKDIDVDIIIDSLKNGDFPSVVSPDYDFVIEIYRFVLDITYYHPTDTYKNRIQTHLIDMRKPRGWGGYAEENMGVVLIPATISNYENVTIGVNQSEKAVKDIINTWINLAWEPDFLQFWKKSGSNIMPTRLERYLEEELGIVLLT